MLLFFFLQVTNPPIDPIREKIVMSLVRQCYLAACHSNLNACQTFFSGSAMEEG